MTPRYTIAGGLGFVVVCAVGFAALRTPSPLWANLLYTAAVASLMAAVINAAFARGARRRFWAGFGLCAGPYFAMTFLPGLKDDMGLRLATTPLLDWLYVQIAPDDSAPAPIQVQFATNPAGVATTVQWSTALALANNGGGPAGTTVWVPVAPNPAPPAGLWAAWTEADRSNSPGYQFGNVTLHGTASYRRVGHSLLALLVGLVGGALTRRAFADPDPARPPTPAPEALPDAA